MFYKIAEKITDKYARENLFKEEDKEIYVFGLNQMITYITNMFTILILGIIFGEVFESIVYTVTFMLLRTYAGGYHAPTPRKCYLVTIIALLLTLSIIKWFEMSDVICLIIIIISGMIILFLAPVSCENKELDSVEKVIYRKKVYLVWGIEFCIGILLLMLEYTTISKSIMMAHLTVCIALTLETAKKKNKKDMITL